MYLSNAQSLLAVYFLFSPLASAHFLLNYPTSLGFSPTDEGSSPCGGKRYSNSTTSNFHVGGDAIAYKLLHAQANLVYRGTLDSNLQAGWTTLWPVYTQFGLGSFCQPAVVAPDTWVGKTGTIQIAESAEDGVVYQIKCAVVNFVSGKLASLPSSCNNASGVSASFSSDQSLPSGSGSSSSASSSVSASSTPTPTARASTAGHLLLPWTASLCVGLALIIWVL